MANSSWFDESYYLSAKAAYNNAHAINGLTTWTVASVQASLNAAGMTAQQHYSQYGWTEGLSPNAYYVESQYVTSKVAALNAGAVGGRTNWTAADFYASLNGANPFMHYVQYGAYETGVEPSTGFNDDTYYADKAIYNNANAVGGITTWTADTVKAAFQANGLTPIGHYELYGATENFYTPTANPVPGQTFTLTAALDNILGTAGNDLVRGDFTSTMQAGDLINGNGGTDTLQMYNAYDATKMPIGVTNVSIFEFANPGNNNIDLTNWSKAATGLTSVVVDDASAMNAKTITTTAGQSLSLATGVGNGATAGLVTWAASATDTAANLTLDGYQGGKGVTPQSLTITGALTATQNIASTGAANKVATLTLAAATTKLVITGDQALTTTTDTISGASATALKTVDASASTGGVSLTFGALTNAAFAFTGGSGNDTVTFADNELGTLTSGSQLDGGSGTLDKIGTKDTAFSATEYAAINAAKNFEVLGLNAAISVNAGSLTSIKHFSLDTDAAQTITNMANGSIVDAPVAYANAISLGGGVGANTVAINIGTSATSAGTIADLTVGQVNVTLTSQGDNSATNQITALKNADSSNYTILGSNDLTIAATQATATGSVYDGTSFTGKLNITGNTKAFATGSALGDTLIGGSKADTLKASVNGGILTGNGGADTFNVSAALGGTDLTYQTTLITDAAAGDKITFGATAGAFSTASVDLSTATTEGQALDLLAAGNNSDVKWGVWNGNTYLVDDAAAGATFSATDTMVKLTGTYNLASSTFNAGTNTLTIG